MNRLNFGFTPSRNKVGYLDIVGALTVGTTSTLTGLVSVAAGIEMDTTKKVQFRDAAIYIASLNDGYLDIVADVGIRQGTTTFSGQINSRNSNTVTDLILNMPMTSSTWRLRPSGTSGEIELQNDVGANASLKIAESGLATWAAITHSGIVLTNIATGSLPAGIEGAIAYDATLNKLVVYTGAAWEAVTSV